MGKATDLQICKLTNKDKKLWVKAAEYAANCSWQTTGKYLFDKMKQNDFLEWERIF